jgi:hypothetical protein
MHDLLAVSHCTGSGVPTGSPWQTLVPFAGVTFHFISFHCACQCSVQVRRSAGTGAGSSSLPTGCRVKMVGLSGDCGTGGGGASSIYSGGGGTAGAQLWLWDATSVCPERCCTAVCPACAILGVWQEPGNRAVLMLACYARTWRLQHCKQPYRAALSWGLCGAAADVMDWQPPNIWRWECRGNGFLTSIRPSVV